MSNLEFTKFNNPTRGELQFDEMLAEIVSFISEKPLLTYKIMIGSDSNGNANHSTLDIVSVIAIHRVGQGGRYFWHRFGRQRVATLRQKIYAEVDASLRLAAKFFPMFRKELKRMTRREEAPFYPEIHVDVGMHGQTRDLVQEITGMVRGYGYEVYVKPESAAATTVADRHVR